jgi:hypothetical protein
MGRVRYGTKKQCELKNRRHGHGKTADEIREATDTHGRQRCGGKSGSRASAFHETQERRLKAYATAGRGERVARNPRVVGVSGQ